MTKPGEPVPGQSAPGEPTPDQQDPASIVLGPELWSLIYPGTKWCGAGEKTTSSHLYTSLKPGDLAFRYVADNGVEEPVVCPATC